MNSVQPWYRRVLRWGQTNLTEVDPARYDAEWWPSYWRRTKVQGLIVNAGGIVSYYPSANPLQHRAEHLDTRDLFGEIASLAREEGLVLVARMDSNRAHQPLYDAHPDWFARQANGEPYRAGECYITCVSSPYYEQYMPDCMREIIERYGPDGFTDNSWSGLDRRHICYCENCACRFRDATGLNLPSAVSWDDPAYREWIRWNYRLRVELWELNNRVTRGAGGSDCIWAGMLGGDMAEQSRRFRDYRALLERSEICMLDFQCRSDERGFQSNAEVGKLIHGLLGWEKTIPESMAMYQGWGPTFRVSARPAAEAHYWMVEGFAGGIQPWWHHVGAYHEDRRQYRTAQPLMEWHQAHEQYLVDRRPVATVGVVWSQENMDFYGRDEVQERVIQPYRGIVNALIRGRIPFIPVHADMIGEVTGLAALVLPNLGILSDSQAAAVEAFVASGGGILATGETSRYDPDGALMPDFALADLFGVHAAGEPHLPSDGEGSHTYLRFAAELRRNVPGPLTGDEPQPRERHEALSGFEQTDILPFGGRLEAVSAEDGTNVPLTFVPPFPVFPPETAWMRQSATGLPALVVNESRARRVAYLAADLDSRFGAWRLPDHGDVLAGLVRWVARGDVPLEIEGAGLVDCNLYSQPGRLVLHVVNLAQAGAWKRPLEEVLPLAGLRVRVRLLDGMSGSAVRLLVSGLHTSAGLADGWVEFRLPSVGMHEVIVIE